MRVIIVWILTFTWKIWHRGFRIVWLLIVQTVLGSRIAKNVLKLNVWPVRSIFTWRLSTQHCTVPLKNAKIISTTFTAVNVSQVSAYHASLIFIFTQSTDPWQISVLLLPVQQTTVFIIVRNAQCWGVWPAKQISISKMLQVWIRVWLSNVWIILAM